MLLLQQTHLASNTCPMDSNSEAEPQGLPESAQVSDVYEGSLHQVYLVLRYYSRADVSSFRSSLRWRIWHVAAPDLR